MNAPTASPLYRQIKQVLVERLADGTWPPGHLLPSEMALARELSVHQGTVRKALDEMTAENLVTRRQGRGTFASELSDDRILFNFFKLTGSDGKRRFPESRVTCIQKVKPDDAERQALDLNRTHRAVRISRVRSIDDTPVIVETITVASRLFPNLEREQTVPNNLYALYASRYGKTIGRAEERLTAVNADKTVAKLLQIQPGSALLQISRVAYTVKGEPTEYRLSLCRTDELFYESDLR